MRKLLLILLLVLALAGGAAGFWVYNNAAVPTATAVIVPCTILLPGQDAADPRALEALNKVDALFAGAAGTSLALVTPTPRLTDASCGGQP